MFCNSNKAIDLRHLELSCHKTADNGWLHTEQQHTSALDWGVLNLLETAQIVLSVWTGMSSTRSTRKKNIKAQTDTHQRPDNPDWRHRKNAPAGGRAPVTSERWLWNKSIGNHGLIASGALKKKLLQRRLSILYIVLHLLIKDQFWHNGTNVHLLQNQGTKLWALETFLKWKSCKALPISSHILLIVAMKGQ